MWYKTTIATILLATLYFSIGCSHVEKAVVTANDFAWILKKQSDLPKINKYLDELIILDDFKIVIEPDLDNPAEGYVGFKFTF
jgi:hypothetical protein